jgi:EAL domain-containing protein (putative c-di-GMP-specific phosphodiesterase class I)
VPEADAELAAAVDREVLFQARSAAAGGAVPAVHVNAAELHAGTVRDVLESTGLDPARLVLELSERAPAAARVEGMAALRTIGVRIACDDFGTGRHAVELLRSREIDMLKIARPHVEAAGRAGHDRAVLAMVVQLGTVFGLEVVAQGSSAWTRARPLPRSAAGSARGTCSDGRCRCRCRLRLRRSRFA